MCLVIPVISPSVQLSQHLFSRLCIKSSNKNHPSLQTFVFIIAGEFCCIAYINSAVGWMYHLGVRVYLYFHERTKILKILHWKNHKPHTFEIYLQNGSVFPLNYSCGTPSIYQTTLGYPKRFFKPLVFDIPRSSPLQMTQKLTLKGSSPRIIWQTQRVC